MLIFIFPTTQQALWRGNNPSKPQERKEESLQGSISVSVYTVQHTWITYTHTHRVCTVCVCVCAETKPWLSLERWQLTDKQAVTTYRLENPQQLLCLNLLNPPPLSCQLLSLSLSPPHLCLFITRSSLISASTMFGEVRGPRALFVVCNADRDWSECWRCVWLLMCLRRKCTHTQKKAHVNTSVMSQRTPPPPHTHAHTPSF